MRLHLFCARVFAGALLLTVAVAVAGCLDEDDPPRADSTSTRADLVATVPPALSIRHMRKHLAALQRIADRNGGTRVAGSPGYRASVRYLRTELLRLGYQPRILSFPFVGYEELTERGRQVAPNGRDFEIEAIDYSPSTRPDGIQAKLAASGNGCSPDDFATARGRIALVERSVCFIALKAQNAERAGALALLVFNSDPGGPLNGTLGDPNATEIPVAAIEGSVARSLASSPNAVVRIEIAARTRRSKSQSLIADTHPARGRVLLVGAHLDSVLDGPGINDNGTGVAALLEIARVIHGRAPTLAVRFGFWGAEEFGLIGSRAHARTIRPDELVGYLNFDMLGSRSHDRAVYAGPFAARFLSYFKRRGLRSETIDLTGRSDHFAFEQIGVPTGGLFAGIDSCYHRACDRIESVDFMVLEELAAAAAYGVASLAPRRPARS